MAEEGLYPLEIVTGIPYAATTYLLKEHWLAIRRSAGFPAPYLVRLRKLLEELELNLLEILPSKAALPEERRILRVGGTLSADVASRLKGAFGRLATQLEDLAPIYLAAGRGMESAASVLPHTLLVEGEELPRAVEDLITAAGYTKDNEISERLSPFSYFVSNPDQLQVQRAFALLRRLRSRQDIAGAHFDWVKVRAFATFAAPPSDPYWAEQWDMDRIRLADALDIGSPKPTVKIAVIDTGFDTGHPDISFASVSQLSGIHGRSCTRVVDLTNLEPSRLALQVYDDCSVDEKAHGTAVAGITAAIRDNGEGIAGVAGGFPVVAIAADEHLQSSGFAMALRYAVAAGARVVNMSLAAVETPDAIRAIQEAWASGCVLCAAAGNTDNAQVIFPASCEEVIAVGASDTKDRRKRVRSRGDEQWASSYGPKLDVMAPGIQCWTTDERGDGGFNQDGLPKVFCGYYYPKSGDPDGNYTSFFNGTSAASPHVAGLAALVLAIHPGLTNQEVRDVIEKACDRVRPELYAYQTIAGRTNGTWNDEMGYGRINCYTAVLHATLLKADARSRKRR